MNILFIGLGHQRIAAWINIISNYVLALPMAYVLTFPAGWGLNGIWTGLSIAMYLSAIGQSIYVFFVNWDTEAERISNSIKADELRIHGIDVNQDEQDLLVPYILTPTASKTSGIM